MSAFTADADGQDGLAWALRYVARGFRVFPVRADKTPLVAHWREEATADPAMIKAWRRKWAHHDIAWAMPANVIAVDIDVKHGKNGYADFKRLAGYDPHDVLTPQATTPSGGMQLFYAATKPYQNQVAIGGTGIDTRTLGGYVVLAGHKNGRQWLRPLIGAELLPAPGWLDIALRQERAPLTLAPRTAFAQPTSDSWAQKRALAQLERACAKIVAAPCGAQDSTRHAQCFYIGSFIARGDLGYEEAYAALLEAACAMPVYRDPWRNLDARVARSIESGIERPLVVSETELWVRRYHARMRLRRPHAAGRSKW